MVRPTPGGATLLVAGLVAVGPTASWGNAVAAAASPSEGESHLRVPFVAQTEALCGGAAVAMVSRYWGHRDIQADDFAPLIEKDLSGIRADRLQEAIASRGWNAWLFRGAPGLLEHHLGRGRPVITLIEDRPGRFHYVVVVAWQPTHVVVHDPARGPNRILPAAEFERAWQRGGHLTLLVLPPATPPMASPDAVATAVPCGDLIEPAVEAARAGDLDRANHLLVAAVSACPDGAAAHRELAGLRLRQSRWTEAARLAEWAVASDGTDRHAWLLLAASRFLDGDSRSALRAWNAIDQPRVDLVEVRGLTVTRPSVVTMAAGLSAGELLAEDRVRQAGRRLDALPSLRSVRLSYRPREEGHADVGIDVRERPALFGSVRHALTSVGFWTVARHATVDVSSPTGGGEVWTGEWRWRRHRPRVALGLAVPQRVGGVWRIESSWERERFSERLDSGRTTETRRGVSLEIGDWTTPDVRWRVGAGVDHWETRGHHLGWMVGLESRDRSDRSAVRAETRVWLPVQGGSAFARWDVSGAWRSAKPGRATIVTARAGLDSVVGRAPVTLWPRPDAGQGGDARLRAHPIFRDGIVQTDHLARTLLGVSVEAERPLGFRGPVASSVAVFADTARLVGGRGADPVGSRTHVDVGVGLRLAVPGHDARFRLDVARALRDRGTVFSVGWLAPWPGL